MRKPGRLVGAALAAAALLAIGGCGSDNSGDSASAQANQPARGYEAGSVGAQLKAACKEIGGNFPDTGGSTRCVFDSDATCKEGKISGAAQLNGWKCVVDPQVKAALDRADPELQLIKLQKAKEECEAKGAPWRWMETFCGQRERVH